MRRIEISTGREPALPPAVRTQIPSLALDERTADARGELHHTTFGRVHDAEQRLVPPARPGYDYGD